MAVYKRDMVDINLETGNIHRSFLKHSIGYKDAAADHFGIRVFRNGEPVNLTGVSVQGIFMPPQGDPIAITSGNIVSENEAEVVLPQACYNYDGQFTLAIKLVDPSNSVTGTMRIVDGMVDNTHASGTVAPTDAVPTYQEILAVYAQLLEDVTDYESVVATQDGKIDDLKSAINSQVMTENLMGNEAGVLYPVNIAPGAEFTISSSDGQAFGQGGETRVQLIGSDGVTQNDHFSLVAGNTSRTVTTSNSKPTTYYLRWNQVPRVPMMVVMGATVKSYVPYIYPIREYVNKIEGEIEGFESSFTNEIFKVGDTRSITISGTLNAQITNGAVDAVSYCRMAYAEISDAISVRVTKNAGQRFSVGFSTVVPANNVPLSGIVTDNTGTSIKTEVPSGAKYIVVLYWNTNVDSGDESVMLASISISAEYGAKDRVARKEIEDARVGIDNTLYASLGDAIRVQIREVSNELNNIAANLSEVEFEKMYRITPVYTDNYYMTANGTPHANSDYAYTQKIPVQSGDVIKVTKINGSINPAMRFICAYNGNTAVSSKGTDSQVYTYTVPDGIDSVIITPSSKTVDAIDIYRHENVCFAKTKASNMGYFNAKGDLSDGGSLSLPYENAKNNVVVCFSGRITSFSSITIGKYSSRRYVTITGTQITVNDGTNTYTESHGLTISNDVSVTIISNGKTNKVKQIDIESAGETYTFTNNSCFFEEENGHWSVISDGTEMTDCVLSFTSSNINNKLWMFGDSYFSVNIDRWVYYLLQDNFTAPLINGYSGENAQTAIVGFKNLLSARVPENVLWCLGMNNGDTSSAVNATWLNIYNELVTLSKEYGFNLILATIPNTPTVNNSYKNVIVRESGYQYIDFAAAVNAGNDGSWISGALSNDNVHPTTKGAKILYHRAIADCPQLTSQN